MKKSIIYFATLAICSAFTLTSCDEIFGSEDNPVSGSTTTVDNSEIIQFKDSYAEGLLVQYFDRDGDFKLSMKEAQAVYDLQLIFQYNKYVTSLDELKYFTRLSLIGPEAFLAVTNLKSITIPGSVKFIEPYAFDFCSSLETVTLTDGIKEIREGAFMRCEKIKEFAIPKSVEKIGPSVLQECGDGVEKLIVESGNSYYDSRDNCNCIIETSTNTIIQGCSSSIIPSTIKIIGPHAFSGNYNKDLIIPENIEVLEDYSYSHNYDISTIELPSTIKK